MDKVSRHQSCPHLVLRGLVLGQGVVHVEAEEPDLLQVEAPVDEDPARSGKVFLGHLVCGHVSMITGPKHAQESCFPSYNSYLGINAPLANNNFQHTRVVGGSHGGGTYLCSISRLFSAKLSWCVTKYPEGKLSTRSRRRDNNDDGPKGDRGGLF